MATRKGLETEHLNIKGASLYVQAEVGDIWVRMPSVSDVNAESRAVIKLRRSLYRIRQAPKLGHELLTTGVRRIGFNG